MRPSALNPQGAGAPLPPIDEITQKAAFIRGLPLMSDLPFDEVSWIGSCLRQRSYEKGDVVFWKGEPANSLYLVRQGRVKYWVVTPEGNEKTETLFGPGDFFGEEAILDGSTHSVTAQAFESTHLFVLEKPGVNKLLTQPTLGVRLLHILCQRLQDLRSQITALRCKQARYRILCTLANLSERNGHKFSGGQSIPVRLTHQEIANLAGMTRESTSRTLTALQEEGLIKMDKSGGFVLTFSPTDELL